MDRNREAKRAAIAATNGLSRRRHRTSSLRDSPEEDGLLELQETGRLRDRKKDRDRERERERDRERDRDRDRLNRSKRRRGDRSMHGNSNREDGGDNSSEESVNDEEEDDDGAGDRVGGGSGSMRMLPPTNPIFSSSSLLNQRKSFPPATKNIRAGPTWKAAADEMIGVSVPRKARSASTKRSHEWPSSPGIIGDSIYGQASTSPVRPGPTTIAASSSPAPVSPSGSNVSVKKKLKPSGPKLRPPKTTSKSSSPAQDEIEIEIAEVLYGMMRQPQGPTKQEILVTDSIKFEAKEEMKSSNDGKSRVSSPISNTQSTITLPSAIAPQNSSSTVAPMSAIAPKRKRPRPVKYEDENPSVLTHQNSPISSTSKVGTDQSAKTVTCSPIFKKELGSAAENGVSYGLGQLHVSLPASTTEPQKEIIKQIENIVVSRTKSVTEKMENRDLDTSIEEPQSPKKESIIAKLDDNCEDLTATKANSTSVEVENQLEDKFQIDLMAPPQRSSPERDSEAVEAKLIVTDAETDKPLIKEAKIGKNGEQEVANVELEKANAMVEEIELKKSCIGNNDLQFDLEKPDNRDSGSTGLCGNKLQQFVAKQPQQQEANSEKSAQSNSLPLPMSMAGWPGGIPPFGYMAPLQGPVALDGSTVSSAAAIQPPSYIFSQPRPKRCATHCYIARNICCHQQILKMNSFWPAAAAGCGSLYGAKHLPSAELHANIPARGVNSGPDKGQGPAIFSAHLGTDKGAQTANIVDAAQRKQLLLQQTLPPGAPSNILHGPAFIFPLGQQQAAAAAACVRPGSVKSPTLGCASSSTTSNSTSAIAQVTAAAAPAMSFNYPNLPGNETQYLVLQNNAYPFPIPAHVGAPPSYRGAHAQAMPFFNGSFYSSQMLHPSHLQQQQQQPSSYSQQNQQGHQNTSISSCSTPSQKHQQRSHAGVINGGTGNLQAFPSPKNHSMQQMQMQPRQQQQNQPAPHQARQLESEMGSEDSPSTADSRVTRGGMSIYGHNFAMPIHGPNFALMTPASFNGTSGTSVASGNNNIEKKQLQQQGSKDRVEASQAFAMSFASINGSTTTPGFDIASIAQHPAILQNVPDVRQGYHFMAAAAAAQAAQHKKTTSVPEQRKNGGDSSNGGEERKTTAGKDSAVGQSIAFTRPDLSDAAGSTIPGNTLIDISARSLNLGSATARASGSVTSATISGANASNTQQQMQRNHHQQQMPRNQQQQNQQPQLSMQQNQQQQLSMQQNQQQLSMPRYQHQMIHVQKQQHQHAAVARSKAPATSNGSVYNDHLRPSSVSAKFPNAVSSFSQNLNQSSSSPVQSPQWKNSPRSTPPSQTPPSMASSTSSLLKSLPQQGRPQQGHTQISFAANPKSSTQGQGVQPASSHQSPSPPVMVGSPTTSSVSKGGGSPRTTTSTSTGNKTSQASLSSQQAKNSSASSLKSSPVGGRNVPSILGNPHTNSSLSTVAKPQQQQQLSNKSMQQAQLYFSNAYMHSPAPQSNNTTSSAATSSGYYHQRRRPEQQQQQSQSSSSGMLSLCTPVTLPNNCTSDPAKAAAAAMKGGLHSQTLIQPAQFAAAQSGSAHQLIPAGFPYVHAVSTAVQVKPAEQKQPAGE